jgi:quinol monooxygenase YgiN
VIIVTGSVLASRETVDAVVELSLAHVHRSRDEPGCLLHSVHQDVEQPLRIVFLEHWQDGPSLAAHFEEPASVEFVVAITALAAEPPSIGVYEAEPIRI